MKRVILGAFVTVTMFACGGASEEAETTPEETVNTEAVMEMESATDKVEAGITELENDIKVLNAEVDSLLNGI